MLTIAVLLAATAASSRAQTLRDIRNPWSVNVRERLSNEVPREEKPPAVPTVYASVALAGICVVGFKKPKRTHLD
jgi:hypothetical protein